MDVPPRVFILQPRSLGPGGRCLPDSSSPVSRKHPNLCPMLKSQARPPAPCVSAFLPPPTTQASGRTAGASPTPPLPLTLSHPLPQSPDSSAQRQSCCGRLHGGRPRCDGRGEPGAPALFCTACQPQHLSYLLLLLSVSPAGRATSATSSWSLASCPAFQSAPHTAAGDSTVTHRAEHVPPWLRTPWRPSTAPKV